MLIIMFRKYCDVPPKKTLQTCSNKNSNTHGFLQNEINLFEGSGRGHDLLLFF